jgi:hypothetical protein
MKKLFFVLPIILALGVLVVLAAVPANPYDFLQLGNVASEASHNAVGFGPVEPTTHPGGWGNIGAEPAPSDNLARVVWAGTEPDHFVDRGAAFTMTIPKKCGMYLCDWYKTVAKNLKLRVLDGAANDDFVVMYKNGAGNWELLSVVQSDASTSEYWTTKTISLLSIPSGLRNRGASLTFKVVATGNAWSLKDTYGQLAIDYATLEN